MPLRNPSLHTFYISKIGSKFIWKIIKVIKFPILNGNILFLDMPITDITKLIGREWKELPKEKQQVFKTNMNFFNNARFMLKEQERIKKDTKKILQLMS